MVGKLADASASKWACALVSALAANRDFTWCHHADTLAWATGTRVGASDHAIALVCILYGCVLGLYFDTLHFEGLIVRINECTNYICGCDAHFVIVTQFSCVSLVSVVVSRKRSCGVAEPPQHLVSEPRRLSFHPGAPPPAPKDNGERE